MRASSELANADFIALGLYELGAVGVFVDVEDLFEWCYRAAPERFKWRKYGYPNYKFLSQALFAFERKYPHFTLKTQDGNSRQLTAEGARWVEQRLSWYQIMLKSPEKKIPTRRTDQRILNDLSNHGLFRAFLSGQSLELDKYEVSDLLMCSPDSPVEVWRERLETYKAAAAAAKRTGLVEFLQHLWETHPEWFGGSI
jgi:hypothetical protein